MAWYPTALLPSQGVRWAAVDDQSAQATLVDGQLALNLLFRFDEAGLIASVHAVPGWARTWSCSPGSAASATTSSATG